jgi:hypothetical protein
MYSPTRVDLVFEGAEACEFSAVDAEGRSLDADVQPIADTGKTLVVVDASGDFALSL